MNIFKKFIKQNYVNITLLTLGLLICVAAVWSWFSSNSIIYFVDSLLPLDTKNAMTRFYYSVEIHRFPWNSESGSWSITIYVLMVALGRQLLGSLSNAQFTIYIFLLFFCIASFYFLSNYLLFQTLAKKSYQVKFKIISFIFSLLYTFNIYTFYHAFFMFNPDAFIFAFLPLNMLALFKIYPLTLNNHAKKIIWILIFFLTVILMSSGFGTYIFLAQYLIWIFLYLAAYVFISRKRLNFIRVAEVIIFFILIMLSQWWWFLPAIFGFRELYDFQSSIGTTEWFTMGSLSPMLLNSMRLIGLPMMDTNPFSWSHFYKDRIFTLPLFIFPVLVLYFLFQMRIIKARVIFLYLFVMLIISLFIVKFSNPPFSFITRLAFEHVPFFGAFRSSYHKAGIYYFLPYILITCNAAALLINSIVQKQKKFVLVFLCLVLTATVVVITGPYFLFNYDNVVTLDFESGNKKHTISAKTQIPPEYYELKKVFEQECRDSVVLVVPRGAWISSAEWPQNKTSYLGVDILTQIINCSFITTLSQKPKSEVSNQAFYVLLQNGDYDELKRLMYKTQISYILLRFDSKPHYFSAWQYIDPISASKKLDQDQDFEKKVINEFFTVYKFKKSVDFDKQGFALHSSATYTDSPLTRSTDYALVSETLTDVIGPALINSKDDFNKYKSSIGSYLPMGFCSECATKGEIERLEIGTKKKLSLQLEIARDGEYFCSSKVHYPGSVINSVGLEDFKGKKTTIDISQPVKLKKGSYTADISYSTQTFIDKKSVLVSSGEVLEIEVGKLYDRGYRLSYTLDNKDQDVSVIFSRKKIGLSNIKKDKLDPESIIFTSPAGGSEKQQVVQRVFQIDEFNVKNYYLYIRVNPVSPQKKSPVEFKNLLLERAVDTNYVGLACYLQTGEKNIDMSNKLKITKITPIEYTVTLPTGFKKGFLTYNKTFADDWQAYATLQNGEKIIYPHLQSGYSSAWFIENPKSRELTVVFSRHDIVKKNAIITFILFPLTFGIYIWIRRKK